VEALFPRAIALSKHVMIGGIDTANEASIRFHERLGFERVAYFREVGHKFGAGLTWYLCSVSSMHPVRRENECNAHKAAAKRT
jgi:L-amino acid N-acyltransferase YncA